MSKGLKIMLFWTLLSPLMIIVLHVITDLIFGNELRWSWYAASFLGIALGGLIFGGPLHILIVKSSEE